MRADAAVGGNRRVEGKCRLALAVDDAGAVRHDAVHQAAEGSVASAVVLLQLRGGDVGGLPLHDAVLAADGVAVEVGFRLDVEVCRRRIVDEGEDLVVEVVVQGELQVRQCDAVDLSWHNRQVLSL